MLHILPASWTRERRWSPVSRESMAIINFCTNAMVRCINTKCQTLLEMYSLYNRYEPSHYVWPVTRRSSAQDCSPRMWKKEMASTHKIYCQV